MPYAIWRPQGKVPKEGHCPLIVLCLREWMKTSSDGLKSLFSWEQNKSVCVSMSTLPLSASRIQTRLHECFPGQLGCIQSWETTLIFAKPTKISDSFSRLNWADALLHNALVTIIPAPTAAWHCSSMLAIFNKPSVLYLFPLQKSLCANTVPFQHACYPLNSKWNPGPIVSDS